MKQKSTGFTLIELLVVISIIGVLATLIINNLQDARGRARDSKLKQNLIQLKTALRLYYNDFQTYPGHNAGNNDILGCGTAGTTACGGASSTFSAGAGSTVYIKELPEFSYYEQTSSGDGFILKVNLENISDPDIASSQSSCGIVAPNPNDFVICSD